MPSGNHGSGLAPKLALLGLGLAGGYAAWRLADRTRIAVKNQHLRRGHTIIILGAGFGGRQAALELAKQLPNPGDGEIVLIDQEGYLLFTPMLTEAAGGELDVDHIVSPVTQLPARVRFMQGRVTAIDLAKKQVTLLLGEAERNLPQSERTLEADHLVLALGSVSNFHHVPGLEENSLPIKSLSDAATLRQRMLEVLQRASNEPDPGARRQLLSVVVGGAGLTGVETMAALNDLLRQCSKSFPRLDPREIRTVLIDPGSRILPELDPELARYAQHELERRQVEVRLNSKITAAGPDFVELNSSERITTRTLVWAGGVTPNPVIKALDCAHSPHGALIVDQHLAVVGQAGVWALGDSARVPQGTGEKSYAPTAQNAVREGALVARNIAAALRGESPKPFLFRPLGELALVGRHAGVGQILGVRFKGLTAWAMWRLIYWSKMPGIAQRARIMSDWALDLAFGRNLVPLPHLPGNSSASAGNRKNAGNGEAGRASSDSVPEAPPHGGIAPNDNRLSPIPSNLPTPAKRPRAEQDSPRI